MALSLTCDGCGAPLPAPQGRSELTCSYCRRELLLRDGATTVQGDSQALSSTDALLRGYTGHDVGTGRRYVASERPDWADPARTLWPSSAEASSSFGMGWSAATLVGPPRVFPSAGDLPGAWAPVTARSRVEWVDVGFPSGAPAARAIRVFETNMPGATFAITLLRGAGSARTEELIWQRAPSLLDAGGARILEVELPQVERLERVRVYVANDLGSSWSEIDTVGLVTVEPVPAGLQRRVSALRRHRGCFLVLAAGALLAGGLSLVGLEDGATPPPAAEVVPGSTMMVWNTDVPGMARAGVVWGERVIERSSEYSGSRNAAHQVVGPPDVYPHHGDRAEAWAPAAQNAGLEHIDVAFAEPIQASAIVVVETFHPGALARIEDISEGRAPALLWAGSTQPMDQSRVLSLELLPARRLSAVRLVLDTTRATGWNEIDAVGLVPAR